MAIQPFDVEVGYSIDEANHRIGGTGIPGSGTNDSTAQTVPIGSIYQRNAGGNVEFYQKITAGTATTDWVRLATVEDVQDSLSVIEWQDSVLDKDIVTPPVSPSVGDRYLIGLDPGAAAATGAWTGQDGDIAEWDGSSWVFTTPTTGTFVAADDEPTVLYYYGGTLWESKAFESTTASTGLTKVGNDIQLADTTSNTISVTSGTIEVIADGIDDTHIDFGLGANQVSAVDLPYDNTTSGLTATETQSAIDEVEGRVDTLEAASTTQTNSLANTAATEAIIDTVLVDNVAAVTWHVHLLDTVTGDVEFVQVSAIHDGSANGTVDATAATFNVYSKLRDANVAGDVFAVDVNGTGGTQTLRLKVTANNIFDVRALRAETILWTV